MSENDFTSDGLRVFKNGALYNPKTGRFVPGGKCGPLRDKELARAFANRRWRLERLRRAAGVFGEAVILALRNAAYGKGEK